MSSAFQQAAAQIPRREFIVENCSTSAMWRVAAALAASPECPLPIVRIEHRAGKRPHEANYGSERAAGVKTARFQSVQRFPARHLPRFQGNERYSRVWNGRAGSARPSGSSCVCRSAPQPEFLTDGCLILKPSVARLLCRPAAWP